MSACFCSLLQVYVIAYYLWNILQYVFYGVIATQGFVNSLFVSYHDYISQSLTLEVVDIQTAIVYETTKSVVAYEQWTVQNMWHLYSWRRFR
jgi:hypothetical protein